MFSNDWLGYMLRSLSGKQPDKLRVKIKYSQTRKVLFTFNTVLRSID